MGSAARQRQQFRKERSYRAAFAPLLVAFVTVNGKRMVVMMLLALARLHVKPSRRSGRQVMAPGPTLDCFFAAGTPLGYPSR